MQVWPCPMGWSMIITRPSQPQTTGHSKGKDQSQLTQVNMGHCLCYGQLSEAEKA